MSPGGVLDVGQQALASEALADPRREEQALLVRLRRGDPEAFESLVLQHQDRLYDFCFRMLGDREEAHDLVQEIFVSVHQNVRRFREDARLSTWLFRISKNHCLNRLKYLQRRGRGRSDVFDEVSAAAIAEGGGAPPQPDAALDAARERARVQRAISQLDPDARMLVALRDIEGLSYDEIVDITELPEGTVKSRLHRAREKLANLLGRFEP
ncbi:sigma-70 family RNA polymerase sigma factor [Corallococcus sp. CA049B]|uniref:RNA polymerase sigma factor n=1 Tax=Corallococcus sp. CA049B TaxID=2316730 RepID=UPI000EA04CFA|nr:sigma-70 family RNA polymerase sigma factor [Corallococcus sp. CA049B]NOJ95092.1 sigma-70 family RNA polymerase sigma factor [Corallococcus coralloides]RKG86585.1 sigma-70 family RNA polymerase sigma factor [Corallococcus sp. CA049B]